MTPQELKNSILQLAIQGKLVEQRPGEGTAEELYQQIQAEKRKLVKEGKIKMEKPLPPITEDESPFDIPDSWKWVRLGDCSSYAQHKEKVKANTIEKEVWSLDLEDIEKETGRILQKCLASERKIAGDKVKFYNGQVLYSKLRPYLKKVLVAPDDGICSSEIVPFSVYGGINPQYVVYVLICPYVDYVINSVMYGVKMPRVGTETMVDLLVPLPPLAEQNRIVAKIEELLPYIDRYEQAWSRLEEFNKRFPMDMQKSILQLAVQGKLVEQHPEEGTAEELYKQIQSEKRRLIKEGKIKRENLLPEITENEVPFEIPDSWKWVRIGEIFSVIRGSSPRPKGSPLYWSKENTGLNWITIRDISANVKNKRLVQTQEHLTVKGAELSTFVEQEELIIAVSGSTTGKHCLLGISGYIYDGLAAVLNPTKMVYSSYIFYFFNWIYERLNAQKIGSAFPNINTDVLKRSLFPLPPLAEQRRIVAKLEELLPLCERLK